MVPLTTAANPVAARIIAAHLGAEGIVWELRGNVDGPYPVGPVEVLVAEEDLDVARQVVVEEEPEEIGGAHDELGRAPKEVWILLATVLIAALILLGRLLVLAAAEAPPAPGAQPSMGASGSPPSGVSLSAA
jgi:hypothetical protein